MHNLLSLPVLRTENFRGGYEKKLTQDARSLLRIKKMLKRTKSAQGSHMLFVWNEVKRLRTLKKFLGTPIRRMGKAKSRCFNNAILVHERTTKCALVLKRQRNLVQPVYDFRFVRKKIIHCPSNKPFRVQKFGIQNTSQSRSPFCVVAQGDKLHVEHLAFS